VRPGIEHHTDRGVRATGESPAPEFTYDAFRHMVGALYDRGYRFESFASPRARSNEGGRFVLMRHDLDFDLKAALRLAQVEGDEGVRATYFFRLRTDLYNLFSAEGSATVRCILQLGHHAGLHFDCAAYPSELSVAELAQACTREAQILEHWFNTPLDVVSFHRPGPLVLSGNPGVSAPRCHTYMAHFTQAVQYLSDSQGQWRFGAPLESEAFRLGKPMHLLIHPIWWNEACLAPYERLTAYRDARLADLEMCMARNCKVYRRGRLAHVPD
jgi:hypothetical protein